MSKIRLYCCVLILTYQCIKDVLKIYHVLNAFVPTIKYLIEQQAKIVVISHCGRPKGEFVRELSLAPIADILGRCLGQHVKFAVECVGADVKETVDALVSGEVFTA